MSSLTKYLQERISELESQINSNTGDLETLKKELNRIQNLEMEEDLRESDNRNLLQG
jgi:TolA-binding protein